MHNVLTERALLVRPSISLWRGEVTDRALAADTAQRHSADRKAIRTSKFLVPREAIDPILSAAGDLRTFVRRETLPWRWDGVSLLPTANYFPFIEGWNERRALFDQAALNLIASWDQHVATGKLRLGGLANNYDYPSVSQIAGAFRATLEAFPVPDAADFRASIAEAEADNIRDQMREAADAQLSQIQGYIWQQMSECVDHIVERLSAYTRDPTTGKLAGKFHDTLIGNLRDLVDRLSRLNLTEDPNIEAMRQRLATSLCPYEPEDLRRDDKLRLSVRDEAQRIAADMAAIWQPRLASLAVA